MRVLRKVKPTDEQLKIISRTTVGVEVIRGAAGSGKTTTALLRLYGLTGLFMNRRKSQNSPEPVRALVLTFNRTLRGYIQQLAAEPSRLGNNIDLSIDTFARWAKNALNVSHIVSDEEKLEFIQQIKANLHVENQFLFDEVEYILGRFSPGHLDEYLTTVRHGRGIAPRIERETRERILRDVVTPYLEWKRCIGKYDWSDLSIGMRDTSQTSPYDIIIVDETQDLSANQIRAVLKHAAEESAVIFILDSAQRIYAHGFTWSECGINLTSNNSHRLERNYRNTIEIARFAAPLVEGITKGDIDATIPDLKSCKLHGDAPKILVGRFSLQMSYAINFIRSKVNLKEESVAFLHPKGKGWFNYTKRALTRANLPFVDITRLPDWPEGEENIALSTIHSAKGLEFDHVFLLGLNSEVLRHGMEDGDDTWISLRRLLAMGITRARLNVIVGYVPADRSDLMDLFSLGTYEEVVL